MFCAFFAGILKIIARGMGFQHDFSDQGIGVFRTFLVPGGLGIRPFKRFPGGLPGGLVRLELTDTLSYIGIHVPMFVHRLS